MHQKDHIDDGGAVTGGENIRPLARTLGICLAVLVAEPILLTVLTRCFPLPLFEEGLLEGVLLLAFLLPALLVFLIRPFQRQIEYGKQLAAGLAAARNQLEERVEERSGELLVANTRLHNSMDGLARSHKELVVLREMGALLQVCSNIEEAEELLGTFVTTLFPDEGGAVYLYRSSRNLLERTVAWGEGDHPVSLEPDDCWALRCGEAYSVAPGQTKPRCRHNRNQGDQPTLCIPLSSHGEMAGLLLLSATMGEDRGKGELDPSVQTLAVATGQKIALAFSNLHLQEKLRDQAIRDPLTGLYNRRYFEESFEREIARATRSGVSIGLIMVDIDHFKKFNDTVGHQGGDAVLQHVGHLFRECLRHEDIACRYGGEEFALMLTDTPLHDLVKRAEQLRAAVEALQATWKGQLLKRITISCGVAAYAEHGAEVAELVRAADAALYEAKRQGRNRVVSAPTSRQSDGPSASGREHFMTANDKA